MDFKQLCAAALLTLPAVAGAQQWTALSPGGGSVTYLLADPATPGRVYATGTGLFVSEDAGRNWRPSGNGLHATARGSILGLVADPDQPGRLYLFDSAGRLMRSDDAAQSWSATGFQLSLASAPFGRGRLAMADVPGSTGSLLVVGDDKILYKSTDSGVTFVPLSYIASEWRTVETLVVDPAHPQNVYAGIGYGATGQINGATVLRSNNGGVNWAFSSGDPGIGSGSSIVFRGAGRVTAVLNGRVHESVDGGGSWTATNTNAYLLARVPSAPHEVIAMTGTRCARSPDFSVGAQDCSDGLPTGSAFTRFTDVVAVADGSGYRALATGAGVGVRALTAVSAWAPSNAGLNSRLTRGLALLSGSPQRLVAGSWPAADSDPVPLVTTQDGGVSWQTHLSGQMRYVRTLALDPTTPATPGATRLYAGGYSVYQSGGPVNSSVFRSSDGGASWTSIGQGMPVSSSGVASLGLTRTLRLDPRSCAEPPAVGPCRRGPLTTLFALAAPDGWRVAKGLQGGDSWISGDHGLPGWIDDGVTEEAIFPMDLDFDASNGDLLLATISDVLNADGSPAAGTIVSGVFRSTDGGINWQPRSQGLPLRTGSSQTTRDVYALAAHPRRSGVFWASTVQPGQATRIYKTLDGGANWFPSGVELPACDVRDLQVDLSAPDVIYAAGIGLGFSSACLYRSEDGGASWNPVSAPLLMAQLYDLRWSEQDQGRLVMTSEIGVWELRAPSDKIFVERFGD